MDAACRLEMPRDQRNCYRGSVARVDQPNVRARRKGDPQRRVEITSGCGRPAPDRVLDELAVSLLAEQTAADVCACLGFEESDRYGVSSGWPRLRGRQRLQIHELRLDHPGRYDFGPLQSTACSAGTAKNHEKGDRRALKTRHRDLPPGWRGP